MIKLNLILIGLLAIGAAACGSRSKESKATAVVQESLPQDPVLKKGKSVYRANCMACHQKNGRGIKRVSPPLTNTEWVMGGKERLINIVLKGFNEKIEIEGVEYNGMMASFAYLSDEKIAAVLTYVRQSFGNDAPVITVDEVTAVRAE